MRKMFLGLLDVSDLFLSVLDVSTQMIAGRWDGGSQTFQGACTEHFGQHVIRDA